MHAWLNLLAKGGPVHTRAVRILLLVCLYYVVAGCALYVMWVAERLLRPAETAFPPPLAHPPLRSEGQDISRLSLVNRSWAVIGKRVEADGNASKARRGETRGSTGEQRPSEGASRGLAAGGGVDLKRGRRPGVFNLRGIVALTQLNGQLSAVPRLTSLTQHSNTTGVSVLDLVGGRHAFPKFEEGREMLARVWLSDEFWWEHGFAYGRNVIASERNAGGGRDTRREAGRGVSPETHGENSNALVVWLMDIIGDSFSRAQYRLISTLIPEPYTPNPEPRTLTPKPCTLNPKPLTIHHKP